MGHTNATYDQALAGIEAGITYSTHTFCAMREIHHREPGPAGVSLMDDRIFAEVLSDGLHLHPEIVRMIHRIKGDEGIVLATDAMAGAGLSDGEYWLAGRKVRVEDGKTISLEGRIAGGIGTMDEIVKNAMTWLDIPLFSIIKMATLNPARAIGISKTKGSITPGKNADLVICERDFTVWKTIVAGEIIYQQ